VKSALRSRHRLLALALTVGALAATWSPLSRQLEATTLRVAARLAPATPPARRVAVVTLNRTGPAALRQQAAQVIEQLTALGVGPIGLLLPLDRPTAPPGLTRVKRAAAAVDGRHAPALRSALDALDGDARLAAALGRAGGVIVAAAPAAEARHGPAGAGPLVPQALPAAAAPGLLATVLQQALAGPAPGTILHPPLPAFARRASGVAAMAAMSGPVTGMPLVIRRGAARVPAMTLALAAAAKHRSPAALLAASRTHGTADGFFYPRPQGADAARRRVAAYSARSVLAHRVPVTWIRGKPVVVAPDGASLTGPAGGTWSRGAWTARTLAAYLDGNGVRVPGWFYGGERAAVLILGLGLILLPRRLRGRAGLAASAVVAAVAVNAGLLGLLTHGLWLPVAAPAAFLLGAHMVLAWNHGRESALARAWTAAWEARRALGLNLQSQGRLDAAFEQLRDCGDGAAVHEALYDLGLEYERRRQFPKAAAVYERLAERDPRYRDVPERLAHLRTVAAHLPVAGPGGATASGTLVLSDASVEKPALGRYRVERLLGQGAMGAVYLGEDPDIGRPVAIKALPLAEEFEGDALEHARRRLRREAEAAGRLRHPNIVTVYDVGEEHDLAYIAMDYAEGRSLEACTDPGGLLPVGEVLAVGAQVADALDYAHGRKVVHRDIKPANIIYDRDSGAVKVTDFGVAALADDRQTRTGTVLGSPSYMSPEQIAGSRLDGRSDLFSLGVTLYQLLSGRLPFEGDSLANLAYRITHDKHAALGRVRRGIPACASRVVNKALQKDPARRFASGADMAAALRRCAGDRTRPSRRS